MRFTNLKREREGERGRERNSIWVSCGCTGALELGPFSAIFWRTLAGSWIRSRGTEQQGHGPGPMWNAGVSGGRLACCPTPHSAWAWLCLISVLAVLTSSVLTVLSSWKFFFQNRTAEAHESFDTQWPVLSPAHHTRTRWAGIWQIAFLKTQWGRKSFSGRGKIYLRTGEFAKGSFILLGCLRECLNNEYIHFSVCFVFLEFEPLKLLKEKPSGCKSRETEKHFFTEIHKWKWEGEELPCSFTLNKYLEEV